MQYVYGHIDDRWVRVICCAGIWGCVGTSDTLRVTAQKICFFKVYVVTFLCSALAISGVRGGAVGCGRKVAGSISDHVMRFFH